MQGFLVGSGWVINSGGGFVGSGILISGPCTCGYLSTFGGGSATVDTQNLNATGQVNTNTLVIAGRVAASGNAIWTGQGVQCNDWILGSQFGIFGVAMGVSGTFQALNGATIQVIGGIITHIG